MSIQTSFYLNHDFILPSMLNIKFCINFDPFNHLRRTDDDDNDNDNVNNYNNAHHYHHSNSYSPAEREE